MMQAAMEAWPRTATVRPCRARGSPAAVLHAATGDRSRQLPEGSDRTRCGKNAGEMTP